MLVATSYVLADREEIAYYDRNIVEFMKIHHT